MRSSRLPLLQALCLLALALPGCQQVNTPNAGVAPPTAQRHNTDVPVYTPLGFAEVPSVVTIPPPLKGYKPGDPIKVVVTAEGVHAKTPDPNDKPNDPDLPHRKFSENTIVVFVVDTADAKEKVVDMVYVAANAENNKPHDYQVTVKTPASGNFRVQAFNLQIGNWKGNIQDENDNAKPYKPPFKAYP